MRAASLLGTPAGPLWLGLFWALALVLSPALARAQAEGISWHRVAELNAAVYGELH